MVHRRSSNRTASETISLETVRLLDLCIRDVHGNGIPRGNGNPWDSHANGNKKQISMGMEMGMISVGVGMWENAL